MFQKLVWRIRKRRFCKANRWFCPDCIYHEHLWDGLVYRGVRCHYPMIKEAPAADVRPVVRCGECKYCVEHYDTDGNAPYWVCKEWDSGTDYDGYCYHGEKKGR